MQLKNRARQLMTDIPALFIALRRRETPAAAKLLAALTVAYALSPVDLIPDFIPVLGCLDDVILLPLLIALTLRCIPAQLMESCREESRGLWADGRPKKWYFAVPVVLIWALILLLLYGILFRK